MKELEFECCFCSKDIESSHTDPCDINILMNIDKPTEKQYSQSFYCHLVCFKEKLTPKIPLYLEHLLDE